MKRDEKESKLIQSAKESSCLVRRDAAWLFENGFNVDAPNPTNEVVACYYGVKPLWKTAYSQGVVVKAEKDSDYYIVMECSSKNKGYRHAQVILTMGGCM